MHIFILHNHFIALISWHSFHFIHSFIELCNFAFYFVTFVHVTNTKPILYKTKPKRKIIYVKSVKNFSARAQRAPLD